MGDETTDIIPFVGLMIENEELKKRLNEACRLLKRICPQIDATQDGMALVEDVAEFLKE